VGTHPSPSAPLEASVTSRKPWVSRNGFLFPSLVLWPGCKLGRHGFVPSSMLCPPEPCLSMEAMMAKPTEKEITLRAYQIWEENNRPAGRDSEFYKQAEKEVNERPKKEPTLAVLPE
jgi:hypothetical protein